MSADKLTRNWKKVKSSGAFHRRVQQNLKKILNSTAGLIECRKTPSEIHSNLTTFQDIESLSSSTGGQHHHQVILVQNDIDIDTYGKEENRDKWLVELEDDEDDFTGDSKYSDDDNEKFRNDLKQWANTFNITHRSLKELMQIINNRWPKMLPQDPRTFLETPTTIVLQKIGDGFYWHQGLEFCLKKIPECLKFSEISLNVNIDGLPIYKSSKDEFWPILCNIHEIPEIQPMVIGIFSGKGKPPDVKSFLTPFVDEMKILLGTGVHFDNGHELKISIRCFICDSPERAFIKGVANFNGQHGCLKCTTIGEYSYLTHCNIFPRSDCPKRTDDAFRKKIYDSHHKYYSPLEELPINMIDDFPIADSLHLIDLGIVKRCLFGWRDGTFKNFHVKWCAKEILEISKFLQSCKMPVEIHRAVRGLECLAHWKGLEYRTFLHYVGPVILKKYLPYDVYEHFLLFFCAITICSSEFYRHFLDLAEILLQNYLEKYREIYGDGYMTSNVHNIAHIMDDVRKFGVLSTFSSYPFENKLYQIKQMLRHARNPLSQVARRISELSKIDRNVVFSRPSFPSLKKQNDGNGIHVQTENGLDKTKFFYRVETNSYILSNDTKNKWFLTHKNEVAEMKTQLLMGIKFQYMDAV